MRMQMKYCFIQFGTASGLGTHRLHDALTSRCPTCGRGTDLAWPHLPSSRIVAFFHGFARTWKDCSTKIVFLLQDVCSSHALGRVTGEVRGAAVQMAGLAPELCQPGG